MTMVKRKSISLESDAPSSKLATESGPPQVAELVPELGPAFDAVAQASLPLVAMGFTLFHFFLAVAYAIFLPPAIIPNVVPLVAGTAVLLLALYGLVPGSFLLPGHNQSALPLPLFPSSTSLFTSIFPLNLAKPASSHFCSSA